VFGFDPDETYDALVIAPGWKPTKTITDPAYRVTQLSQHAYNSGFLVERDGYKVAWAQTASGACNVLDHALVCADMKFRKCVFAGAAGGLTERMEIGDLCTPEQCISGVYANHYFDETLPPFQPFETICPNPEYTEELVGLAGRSGYAMKTAKVFCTDSISLEYSHLEEIKATGAELIEMETGTFFTLAELFDVPYAALLAVSDNSATGVPLLGRGEDLAQRYRHTRGVVIPDMIFRFAAM
jgi:nucleoside phosphorylase